MRESFVFYQSFFHALKTLPDDIRLKMYDTISSYGLTGLEPDLEGIEKTIFILIKPQLDANFKRYENGKKGAMYGVKGGRPKNPKITPPKPQNNPTETPNVNSNENVNVNLNENKQQKISLEMLSTNHVQEWLAQKRVSGKYLIVDELALLEKFKTYCQASGKKYKDYVAAYRNAFDWENVPKKKQEIKKNDWSELYRVPQQP